MSIKDRGKSHAQRRVEHESRSWQDFPESTPHRPQTRSSPGGSSKGISTAHDDGFTSTASKRRIKNTFENLYDTEASTPAPPASGGNGSNEESFQSSRPADTLFEESSGKPFSSASTPRRSRTERSREGTARSDYAQEYLGQIWRQAFLISSRLLAAEHGTPFEEAIKSMNDSGGIYYHIRRHKRTSRLMGMLGELGVTQEMISSMTECLEDRPFIRSMFSEDQGYDSSQSVPFPEDQKYCSSQLGPFPVFWDYDAFPSVPFPVFQEDEKFEFVLPVLQTPFYLDQEDDLFIPSSAEELNRRITITPRFRVPRVPRNFKYWRHARLPRTQKEISPFSNVNGSKISTEGQLNVVDLPIIPHRRIAEWKIRAGKSKDWSRCPIRDLLKHDKLRGHESYKRRFVPHGTANSLGRKMLKVIVFTAACLYGIPRDMLRRYRHNVVESDSSVLLRLRGGTKRRVKCNCDKKKPHYLNLERNTNRRVKCNCDKKKPHYLNLERKAKRDRAIDVKEIISEGIFERVTAHNDSEILDTPIETDEYSTNCSPSDIVPPTTVLTKSVTFAESNTCAAGALSIPYESRIGAIVGGRFVLQGLMSTRLCYDIHAATDVCTDMVYTAKAYSIRGTKGNERKYRIASLKRNASKASCIASADQGGRKWLFFSGGIEHVVQTGILNDVPTRYGEEEYQHHFPILGPRGATCTTAHATPRKTYAACVQGFLSESIDCITREETSCIQEVASQLDDRTTKRKERLRDRQRIKRNQKRAAGAVARKATDDESALNEQTDAAMDMSRPASISHVDPELGTSSIDGADFESLLAFLDEDMRDRPFPGIDETFWKHLTEGPPERTKHRCLEVMAGYRIMSHIGTQLGDFDPRMRPSLTLLDDYHDSLLLLRLGGDGITRLLGTSLLLRHIQTHRRILLQI